MSADGRAEESPQQGIQSIEVGAQVLGALEAGRGPMALSEVARNCAMHPAKVHRYLVSLVRAGLASQDAHRPVRPGAGRPSPRHGGANRLADALRSTAGQISAELGYRPA
jgi:predicted ArsR family transcriptional regulator